MINMERKGDEKQMRYILKQNEVMRAKKLQINHVKKRRKESKINKKYERKIKRKKDENKIRVIKSFDKINVMINVAKKMR